MAHRFSECLNVAIERRNFPPKRKFRERRIAPAFGPSHRQLQSAQKAILGSSACLRWMGVGSAFQRFRV